MKNKLYILLTAIGLTIILIFSLFNQKTKLEADNKELELKAKQSEVLANEYLKQAQLSKIKESALKLKYDSIKSILNAKDKQLIIIKTKYNETIKIVNAYSVSDMQTYYDNRTK